MEHFSEFVVNHWALWLAFMAIIVLIYVNEWFTQKSMAMRLSPQEAVAKINHDAAVVLDLRDTAAFGHGHIIHAIRTNSEECQSTRMDKYKTKPLILVCARGIQSQTTATQLKAKGFTHVMVLTGGITAWQSAGLPLVKGNK